MTKKTLWSDIWHVSYIELRILKSSKPWSSQLWTQFKQLRIEAWKSQDFNGAWTRDLAILVRRSNQVSYEATDIGGWPWSFACIVNCLNCFHNCEDHSLLDFKSADQCMKHFKNRFTFIPHGLIRTHKINLVISVQEKKRYRENELHTKLKKTT